MYLVQFSLLTDSIFWRTWGTNQQRFSSSFYLQEAIVSTSCMGRDVHSLTLVHLSFPLQTASSPTLQGALKDGLGEAVVVCEMPEPCKFLSLNKCQKRFLLAQASWSCIAPSRRSGCVCVCVCVWWWVGVCVCVCMYVFPPYNLHAYNHAVFNISHLNFAKNANRYRSGSNQGTRQFSLVQKHR